MNIYYIQFTIYVFNLWFDNYGYKPHEKSAIKHQSEWNECFLKSYWDSKSDVTILHIQEISFTIIIFYVIRNKSLLSVH